MKIKIIVLDFETPKWLRKAIAYGAPIVGVLVVAGIALAAPHTWNTNDPLTAVDLNGLNRVTHGSTSYSVGATLLCGVSSTTTTGNIFSGSAPGYAGAKAMCEVSPGCNNSPTAHMCTAEEIVRSQSIGITAPQQGWYSTGVHAELEGGTNLTVDDCQGWTSTSVFGAAWGGTTPGSPGTRGCAISLPVLCCD